MVFSVVLSSLMISLLVLFCVIFGRIRRLMVLFCSFRFFIFRVVGTNFFVRVEVK